MKKDKNVVYDILDIVWAKGVAYGIKSNPELASEPVVAEAKIALRDLIIKETVEYEHEVKDIILQLFE
jgi:hypothetical protein